jgi:uncharacterized membrane protein
MQIILIIPALIFILFLPGFIWSFVFFGKKKIDSIERFALSFALSIALVPLVVFYTNLLNLRITILTVTIQIILIILIAILLLLYKKIKK